MTRPALEKAHCTRRSVAPRGQGPLGEPNRDQGPRWVVTRRSPPGLASVSSPLITRDRDPAALSPLSWLLKGTGSTGDSELEFIKTHPELVDRINQLRSAIETQQASPHRPRTLARNTPTPPPSTQRRSLGPFYELPPTPVVPAGPDL